MLLPDPYNAPMRLAMALLAGSLAGLALWSRVSSPVAPPYVALGTPPLMLILAGILVLAAWRQHREHPRRALLADLLLILGVWLTALDGLGGPLLFQLRTTQADLLVALLGVASLVAGGWLLLGLGLGNGPPSSSSAGSNPKVPSSSSAGSDLKVPSSGSAGSDLRVPSWSSAVQGPLLWMIGAIPALDLLATALERHRTFHSNAYDLGIFTQLGWNLMHGHGLASSIRGVDFILTDHAAPTWWLLSPVAAIGDGASALIVLQWLLLVSACYPLYLLAYRRLADARAATLVCVVYLCFPALHWLGLFDVHEVALVPLLGFGLLWFWETRQARGFMICTLLFLGIKEEMGIVLGALGLVLWFLKRDRQWGPALVVLGFGWFCLFALVIQPAFQGGGEYYYVHRYAKYGDSLVAILQTLLTRPQLWLPDLFNLRTAFFLGLLLAPLAFLPLRGWRWLLVCLPTLLYSALSNEPLQTSIYSQYSAVYIPFLFMALIDGLATPNTDSTASTQQLRLALVTALASLAVGSLISPLSYSESHRRLFYGDQPEQLWDREVATWITDGTIRPGASIAASSKYVPHLAQRQFVTRLPIREWHGQRAELLLIDLTEFEDDLLRAQIGDLSLGGHLIAQAGPVLLFDLTTHEGRSLTFLPPPNPKSEPVSGYPGLWLWEGGEIDLTMAVSGVSARSGQVAAFFTYSAESSPAIPYAARFHSATRVGLGFPRLAPEVPAAISIPSGWEPLVARGYFVLVDIPPGWTLSDEEFILNGLTEETLPMEEVHYLDPQHH